MVRWFRYTMSACTPCNESFCVCASCERVSARSANGEHISQCSNHRRHQSIYAGILLYAHTHTTVWANVYLSFFGLHLSIHTTLGAVFAWVSVIVVYLPAKVGKRNVYIAMETKEKLDTKIGEWNVLDWKLEHIGDANTHTNTYDHQIWT